MLARSDEAVDAVIDVKKNESFGQFDLFADLGPSHEDSFAIAIPDLPEWDRKQILNFEREMLGLYVSDHPLSGIERSLSKYQDFEVASLREHPEDADGKMVKIAGLVSGVQTKLTKKGLPWAIVTVEDMTGSIEVLFFPKQYEKIQGRIVQDQLVQVVGRGSIRDEESLSVMGQEITPLDIKEDGNASVDLTLQLGHCVPNTLEAVKTILQRYPGNQSVNVYVQAPDKKTQIVLGDALRVEGTSSLISELKSLLGADCLA